MNKTILVSITIVCILIFGAIFISKPKTNSEPVNNVEIKNGIQYITINAKGGYFPNSTEAKGGIPTKLIMKTAGTFDCSAALVIRSINYQKILKQNGETEIDIGTPKAGEPFYGTCGMGMYNFSVNFN